ncbi:M48 family metallopeptidase [Streptomyces sp. AK02-01A]|uniref:M48 family metallopeptidase n=1 Tax=Streptomyces sp. AK02-01A TaxID=3028648 RepID=UPI0029AE9741|nr:M48 family metallopeptidase [Streptomyces sp. AK02-01A]MDX3851758.1 M48 family metallopeptidase [Streptomyces sp. AK02-01A]
MGATLRALRALVLLTGFYLLGLVMLGVLAGIDWAATLWTPGSVYVKLYVVSVVLAIPIVRGMFLLRGPKDDGPPGLPVTDAREPRLWQTVRALAEQVGTRAPDEIVLIGDTNAAVSEDARLMGLLGGRRRLYLGLPLMAGLTESQLRAVLAHELGHYSNADTRLSAITVRGRIQVLRTIAHFEEKAGRTAAKEQARQEKKAAKALAKGKSAKEIDTTGAGITYRVMAAIYTAYAKLYIRATESGSRRQELAADRAAARIAGRDATASALREIPVLDAAHGFYMNSYATLGVGAGLLPPPGEVFGGIRHLLTARHQELDEMRRDLPTENTSPYDSHPPIAERVARIEALPDDGRAFEPTGPSLALLDSPEQTLAALEPAVLTADALGMRRLDWPELVHESMATYTERSAEPLRRATAEITGDPSLSALLNAIDAGALWQLADLLPKSGEATSATGRAAREFARPALRRGLSQLVSTELVRQGRARWELSWSDPASLRLPQGYDKALPAALDAAVADRPDTEPLRKLLPLGAASGAQH